MKKKIIKDNRGSLTVEAALAVPIFVFSLLAFIFLFKVILLQLQLQTSLLQAAKELSQNSYIQSCNNEKQENNSVLGEDWEEMLGGIEVYSYVEKYFTSKNRFENILKRHISFQSSVINTPEEEIDLVAQYSVSIPVPFFHLVDFPVQQRVKTRGFVGTSTLLTYRKDEVSSDIEEEYVYITESGIVYHRSLQCSHLKLSIKECRLNELYEKRNVSGGKYKPCEKCGTSVHNDDTVYICDDGNAYHTNLGCSGLKRTINRVKLSEVPNNMRGCHKCGT